MQTVFNKYINYLEAERNASPYTVRNYTSDLLGFFQFLRDKRVSSLKEVLAEGLIGTEICVKRYLKKETL